MKKRLRVPKGVTIRGIPRGGRFMSVEDIARLVRHATATEVASVERLLTFAQRQEAKAAAAHQRAAERHLETGTERAKVRRFRAKETQDRWAGTVGRARRYIAETTRTSGPSRRVVRLPDFVDGAFAFAELWAIDNGIELIRHDIEDDDAPPEWVRDQRPRRGTMMTRGQSKLHVYVTEGGEPGEPAAVEWEVSVEYGAGPTGNDVDINIRFARVDARPIGRDEAMRVFASIKDSGGEPPDGYVLAGVDWRNPKKSTEFTTGRDIPDPYRDLAALWAPIFSADTFDLHRMGAVDDE
jgi:hypothetical protein